MSLSWNMHFYYNNLHHSLSSDHRRIIVCSPTTDTLVCPSDAPVCLSNTDLKQSPQSLKGFIWTHLKLICFVQAIATSKKRFCGKTKTKKKKTATESRLKLFSARRGIKVVLTWTVQSERPLVSPHHTPCGSKWCSNIRTNFQRFSPEGRGLVIMSATFSWVLMYAVRNSSRSHPSCTKWNAIICVFVFNMDSGIVVLASTEWLSPNMKVGSSTGIPIILNL